MKCILPTPCRICGLELETVPHLLVVCPHPQAMKERRHIFFKKFPRLTQDAPEEQIIFLLTRVPPPQVQKLNESSIAAYLKARNIKL
jgi:hypothetical protein